MTTEAPATLQVLSTRREAAAFLGVSERQLDAWIATGAIRATRLGRLVKIHRDELERIAREGIAP
jgi:excisionase family DNA binding protein